MQALRLSRCVNPKYPTAQQIPMRRSFVTSDDANFSTMRKTTTEETIAPTEMFFARSAFKLNKFILVFCHEPDPMLNI
jgi:hypothetical protein